MRLRRALANLSISIISLSGEYPKSVRKLPFLRTQHDEKPYRIVILSRKSNGVVWLLVAFSTGAMPLPEGHVEQIIFSLNRSPLVHTLPSLLRDTVLMKGSCRNPDKSFLHRPCLI